MAQHGCSGTIGRVPAELVGVQRQEYLCPPPVLFGRVVPRNRLESFCKMSADDLFDEDLTAINDSLSQPEQLAQEEPLTQPEPPQTQIADLVDGKIRSFLNCDADYAKIVKKLFLFTELENKFFPLLANRIDDSEGLLNMLAHHLKNLLRYDPSSRRWYEFSVDTGLWQRQPHPAAAHIRMIFSVYYHVGLDLQVMGIVKDKDGEFVGNPYAQRRINEAGAYMNRLLSQHRDRFREDGFEHSLDRAPWAMMWRNGESVVRVNDQKKVVVDYHILADGHFPEFNWSRNNGLDLDPDLLVPDVYKNHPDVREFNEYFDTSFPSDPAKKRAAKYTMGYLAAGEYCCSNRLIAAMWALLTRIPLLHAQAPLVTGSCS